MPDGLSPGHLLLEFCVSLSAAPAVRTEREGDILVVTIDHPPVNALNVDVRRGLLDAVQQAQADTQVRAVLIVGAGRAFIAGADIREFGTPKAVQEPNLLSVILRVENTTKPVIAAVHSVCMGGGLELALGAHYRIAAPGCNVALPEVKLGLIPGAGGTQRLPRVLGVEAALNMIVSGEPVKSEMLDRKSTRLNSSHSDRSRMPSSA